MKYIPLQIKGLWLIVSDVHYDNRGEYQRTLCRHEFEFYGLNSDFPEGGRVLNPIAGTVRGLHFQEAPAAQAKLVRCVRGEILDIVVDLRPDSPTFLQHRAIRLKEHRPFMLYVPEGLAHGYQTLTDHAEVEYHMSKCHDPSLAKGVRHNDPRFGITLPLPVSLILGRDAHYPDFAVTNA